MEPKREATKRAASAAAPKQGASKRPEGAEASPSGVGANQQTGQTANQNQNQDLLQHAKQAGGEIVNQVQQQAGTQLDRGKETAANELSQVVNAVRQFGQSLSGETAGPIARYAAEYGDKAADSLERFSNYIRQQDAKRLLNDVENFGRRQPALLLGGAFLLGFAGARLIRSSMEAASQHSTNLGSQSRYNTEVPALKTVVPPAIPQPPRSNTI